MRRELTVPLTEDFIPAAGAAAWDRAPRQALAAVSGPLAYETNLQCLYSARGLYVRFLCADSVLSCTAQPDMGSLYRGDVAEFFLWPSEALPVYFEYELSPLNSELCLLVCNTGSYYGWTPFEYEGARCTAHYAGVTGGEQSPLAPCRGWECGVFLPFALLEGLCPPPRRGDRWRANFYRIDYDGPAPTHFAWETATGKDFHRFRDFGTILFD